MTNRGFSKYALYVLDRLTDLAPSFIPRIVESIILALRGNSFLYRLYLCHQRRQLATPTEIKRVLIIGDLGIGDAVMLEHSVRVVKEYFPDASVDYSCNRYAGDLVRGYPGTRHVFGVFQGHGEALENDLRQMKAIAEKYDYSVILNFSPFISQKNLKIHTPVIDVYVLLATFILLRWKTDSKMLSIQVALSIVLAALLDCNGTRPADAPVELRKNAVYLSANAKTRALEFLRENGLSGMKRKIFFNPDASTRYSQMPFAMQVGILRRLLSSASVDVVLLATGLSFPGIESKITRALPRSLGAKIVVVPPIPLAVYAALVDECEIFISGDGGPVHSAAAVKKPERGVGSFRNRTAVLSVFGASDFRVYGYDSTLRNRIAAGQHAPAKAFVAPTLCRNLTCVNKLGKTCRDVRCFNGLDPLEIAAFAVACLESLDPSGPVTADGIQAPMGSDA
jgi:ADP-heptose:LPS heptosyltransferase